MNVTPHNPSSGSEDSILDISERDIPSLVSDSDRAQLSYDGHSQDELREKICNIIANRNLHSNRTDEPENIKNTRAELNVTIDRLDDIVHNNETGSGMKEALNRFNAANHEYVVASANHIYNELKEDTKNVAPSVMNSVMNVGLGLVTNTGYTIPAMLSLTAKEGSAGRSIIVGAGTAFGTEGISKLTNMVRSHFGIATPNIQLSMPLTNQGLGGTIKPSATKFADETIGAIIYAAVRAGLVQINNASSRPHAAVTFGVGLMSALVMNLVKEAAYLALAEKTRKTNGGNVENIPILEGSRHTKAAAVFSNVKNPFDGPLTERDKYKGFVEVARTISGAIALGLTNHLTRDMSTNYGGEFGKIVAQFTALFLIKNLVDVIGNVVGLDPKKNPGMVNRSAMLELQNHLKKSGLENIVHGLNGAVHVLKTSSNTADSPQIREFQIIRDAVSQKSSRERDYVNYTAAGNVLSGAADALKNTSSYTSDSGLEECAKHLIDASMYMKEMHNQSGSGEVRSDDPMSYVSNGTKMENAVAQIRLSMASILANNTGDEKGIEEDNRIAMILLPIYAAVRELDIQANITTYIDDVADYRKPEENKLVSMVYTSSNIVAEKLSGLLEEKGTKEMSLDHLKERIDVGESTQDALNKLKKIVKDGGSLYAQEKIMLLDTIITREMETSEAATIDLTTASNNDERYIFNMLRALSDGNANNNAKEIGGVADELREGLRTGAYSRESVSSAGREYIGSQAFELLEGISPRVYALLQVIRDNDQDIQNENTLNAVMDESVKCLMHGVVNIVKEHKNGYNAANNSQSVFSGKVWGNSGSGAMNINIEQRDMHFHPTDYDSRRNDDALLLTLMKRNEISSALYAGIPHIIKDKSYYDKTKVPSAMMAFLNSITGLNPGDANILRYTSTDHELGNSLTRTRATIGDFAERISLSITGFDINDGRHMGNHMDQIMTDYGQLVKSVGEVTLYKEVVSASSAQIPQIDSDATRELLNAVAERGLPLLLHCDVSVPGNKGKFRNELISVLREEAGRINQEPGTLPARDKLQNSETRGTDTVPPKKLKVVWAHAAGISRYTKAGNDHTRAMETMFNDPVLKGVISVDVSWDYVAKNIMMNIYDDMRKNGNIPQTMLDGIQAIIKSYDAFLGQAARADEANDGIDRNLAAVHKKASDNLYKLHLEALASWRNIVTDELASDDGVVNELVGMVADHGDRGNNWLYLLNKYSKQVCYGSDSLTPGAKYHGEQAYEMNSKMLYPLYDLYNALGDQLKNREEHVVYNESVHSSDLYNTVTDIARDSYTRVLEDPALAERRGAYMAMLENNVSKSTANVAPISRQEH